MKRRSHGDGGIDQRSEKCWRLRYRVNGKRFTQSFRGNKTDAQKELRRLLRSGDKGEHVAPDRITVGQWIEQWIAAGAPGRSKRRAAPNDRTLRAVAALPRRADPRPATAATTASH